MNVSQLIAHLNAIQLGDLEAVLAKLDEAGTACRALGHEDLAKRVADARTALRAGDVKGFRRNLETVVSKLGHLR